MPCVGVTTAFLLLAALCIQDTTAIMSYCKDFKLSLDKGGWHTFRIFGDIKIFVVNDSKSFGDAEAACTAMGAKLLAIDAHKVHLNTVCWLHTSFDDMQVWVGGKIINGVFRWLNGVSIRNNWMPGQPTYSAEKQCVQMNWEEIGSYSNDPCKVEKPFICEIRT